MKLITLIASLAIASAVRASSCIVSGDPDTVAVEGAVSKETEGIALVTERLWAAYSGPALDIRDWTQDASLGISLNSYPWEGLFLILR